MVRNSREFNASVNCAAAVGGQGKPPTLAEITNEPFFADMNVKVM
jgi:hypothetical protein